MDEDAMVNAVAKAMGVDPYKVRMALGVGSGGDVRGDAYRSNRPTSILADKDRPPAIERAAGEAGLMKQERPASEIELVDRMVAAWIGGPNDVSKLIGGGGGK